MEIYREVFDYPHIRSGNLLESNEADKNPPSTSRHVVQFMGWSTGKHPQYLGLPAGRVLAQKEKWMQLWLLKGRYEDARQRERQAEKESVSAQESGRR